MVLSCIDPRFQPIVYNYLKKKKLSGKYSSFTIAGSAIGVTSKRFKNWHKTFWDNIETSIKLHKVKKLIVMNHRDCGAAKIINGTKEFSKDLVDTLGEIEEDFCFLFVGHWLQGGLGHDRKDLGMLIKTP